MVTQNHRISQKTPATSLAQPTKDSRRASERRAFKSNLRADVIAIAEQMVNWLFGCSPTPGAGDGNPTAESAPAAVPSLGGSAPPANLPTLGSFIRSVVHRTQTPITAIITALIYLCRLKQRHPSCKGSPGAGHRLILAALITATKSLYDDAYHNRSWVTVSQGLFSLAEVNQMEMEFLVFLNFRLCVTRDQWCEFVAIIDEKLQSHWQRTGHYGTYLDMGFSLIAEVIDAPIAQRREAGEPVESSYPSQTARAQHPIAVGFQPPVGQFHTSIPQQGAVPPPTMGSNMSMASSTCMSASSISQMSHVGRSSAPGPPAINMTEYVNVRSDSFAKSNYSPMSSCVTPVDAPSTTAPPAHGGTSSSAKVTPAGGANIKLYRKASSTSFHSLPSSSSSGTISVKPSPSHFRTPTTPNSPGTLPSITPVTAAPSHSHSVSALSKPSGSASVGSAQRKVSGMRHAYDLSQLPNRSTTPTASAPVPAPQLNKSHSLANLSFMLKSKSSSGSLHGSSSACLTPATATPAMPAGPMDAPLVAPAPIGVKTPSRFSPAGLKITQRLKALSFLRPSNKHASLAKTHTDPVMMHPTHSPNHGLLIPSQSFPAPTHSAAPHHCPYPAPVMAHHHPNDAYHGTYPAAPPPYYQGPPSHGHQSAVPMGAPYYYDPTSTPYGYRPNMSISSACPSHSDSVRGHFPASAGSAASGTQSKRHQSHSLPNRTKAGRRLSWPHIFNVVGPFMNPATHPSAGANSTVHP
ncbi:hypothetical protein H4R33_003545 [Dimargaris cristalligena]|nr:hypothetical protein H4R33_003545 [Dimargaris cristalligena]